MSLPVLDATEQRVLGSLLEKQRTVPASYPLSLNALRLACNQTSSRDPVVDYSERTIQDAARALKDRGLLRLVWAGTGSRVVKYHQLLDEVLPLDEADRALLTVLLLSGTLVDAPLFRITVQPTPGNGLQKPSQIMVDRAVTVPRGKGSSQKTENKAR